MAPNPLQLLPFATPAASMADRACFVLAGDASAGPVTIAASSSTVSLPTARRRVTQPFRLHLLHLNDLHGQISRLEQPGNPPILSHVAGRARRLRAQCQDDPFSDVLLLSAGDELAGSVFDDLTANGLLHPVYHLYNQMGLDAAVLGNHDLDLGPRRLAAAIRRHARFPVLAANLAPTAELADLVYPAALLRDSVYLPGGAQSTGGLRRATPRLRPGDHHHRPDRAA